MMGRVTTLTLGVGLGLTLFLAGCGGDKKGRPRPPPYDAFDATDSVEQEVSPSEVPTCAIQKPQAHRILTGTVEARVVVQDPKGALISRVVFAFLVPGQSPVKVGEVFTVPADGVVVLSVDSTKVSDGDRTFFCQVEASDGRKGSAGVSVKVDNTPPKVEIYPPSTPPYSNFLSDLVVRVSVNDGQGVGTHHVIIRVNGDAVADLVKPAPGLQNPVLVPTHELLIGKNTVEITANDLAGNAMTSPLSYWVNFIPPPSFGSSDEVPLPKEATIDRLTSIETSKGFGVVGWGSKGAFLLMPGTKGTLNLAATIVSSAVTSLQVVDTNEDRLQDVVLVTSDATDKSLVQVFHQTTAGAFPSSPSWKATLDGRVNSLAIGDLNRDERPDLVVTLNKKTASVAIALTNTSGPAGTWTSFNAYGGVEEPNLVAIGDFTEDGDRDVLVTRRTSGVVTVFPVNGATGTLLVGINSELKTQSPTDAGSETRLTNIVDLLLGPPIENGDSVLVLDANLNAVARVIPDSSGGLGHLSISATFGTGVTPSRMAKADADGDGREDVAILSPGSSMILLYWGKESGVIEEGPAFLAGSDAADMTLVPVTGGVRPDIVVLDRTTQRLRVFSPIQDAPRRFAGPAMVRLGFAPRAITVGRYVKPLASLPNHRDIALLGPDEKGKSWVHVFAVSDETLLPTQRIGPSDTGIANATDLLSADLDKNGYDDLLVPSLTTSAANKKDPTMGRLLFREGVSHSFVSFVQGTDPVTGIDYRYGMWAGDAPILAVIGDLKREPSKPGVLDLAVIAQFRTSADPTAKSITMFQPFVGQGDGTFLVQEGVLYPVDETQRPTALATSRLTGGSNYDVVMTNGASGEFTVFFAKGLGLFKASEGEALEFAVGPNPKRLAIESLDAPVGSLDDPYPDLVILLEGDVAIVRALNKVGDVVQYAPPVVLGHTGRGPTDIAVRDMNGDGYADIIVLDQQDSMVTIYLNLAQTRFSTPFRYRVGVAPVRMAVADINADACPDIATADQQGQTVTFLLNRACASP